MSLLVSARVVLITIDRLPPGIESGLYQNPASDGAPAADTATLATEYSYPGSSPAISDHIPTERTISFNIAYKIVLLSQISRLVRMPNFSENLHSI